MGAADSAHLAQNSAKSLQVFLMAQTFAHLDGYLATVFISNATTYGHFVTLLKLFVGGETCIRMYLGDSYRPSSYLVFTEPQ